MGSMILLISALYGMVVLGLVVLQRRMMYKPVAGDVHPTTHGLPNFNDILIDGKGGKLQLWYHEASAGMPTVVYFHGNAGHLGDRAGLLNAFAEKGLGVAAVSYRGYGKSKGSPSENGIYADARTAVRWVKSRGIPLSNMVFYGESLGTGVAIKMATEFHPKALFLQSPYTSVVNRASEIYWYVPVRYLIRDRFDSLSRIKQVKVPITVFHGRLDDVIPSAHAERLMEEANEPKKAVFFDTVMHTDFDHKLLANLVMQAVI